jgi:hypothetical protein
MDAARHRSITPAALALASAITVFGACQDCAAQAQRPSAVQTRKPEVAQNGAARDSVSEQELRKRAAATASFDTLMAQKTTPVGEVRPSTQSSLMTSSLFLFDGEMYTIVPMGSILNLPAAHRRHLIAKPEGNFTFWPNFLKRNAKWLAAKEVPLKMAKGDRKAAQVVLKDASADSRVVVSVYKGGPITILEPVPGSESTPPAESGNPEAAGSKRGGKL